MTSNYSSFEGETSLWRLGPFALAALIGFAGVASSAERAPQDLEPHCRIGVLAPLSGPASVYGRAPQRGIGLALHDISHPTLSISYEDHRGESAGAVAAARALLGRDPALRALVVIGASPARAVAPIAASKGVALLAVASDDRIGITRRTKAPAAPVVRVWPSGAEEAELLVEAMVTRGVKDVLLVHDQDDYSRAVSEAISAPTLRVQRIEAPPEATDIRPLLKRGLGPDGRIGAFGLCVRAGRVGPFALQARELGFAGSIFGCVTTENEQEWIAARGALTGAFYASILVRREFRVRYGAEYGEKGFIGGAAALYDVTLMLDAMCRRRESVKDAFRTLREVCEEVGKRGVLASARWDCAPEGDQMSMAPALALHEVPAPSAEGALP